MDYPSLLFTQPARNSSLEYSVFEDLKLTLLISDNAIDAMRMLCVPEDIVLRQGLFKELSSPDMRTAYRKLSDICANMRRLCDALQQVRCDNERYFINTNLLLSFNEFCRNSSMIPGDSVLAVRMRTFFADIAESAAFIRFTQRVEKLVPAAERVRINCFRMLKENLYIRPSSGVTIASRLLRCARDLGLEDTRETRDVSIRLNPRIINALGALWPEDFRDFRDFCDEFGAFFNKQVLDYASQLDFYLEISGIFDRVRALGLPVCWPVMSADKKIDVKGLRDLSLLAKDESNIIPNDILFDENEPFFFLTGANGGGKTTYLRSAGIAVTLFLCGCPVVCDSAEIYPLDCIYTHFPRDERFESEGRFDDEENRVKSILTAHAGNSLVLLNETYSTTTEELALELTAKLADTIYESGSLGIYITHQHGIGSTKIPFLSVIIDEDDANRRTYKIARRRGASGSFARDILKKYGMTKDALAKRFPGKEG